MPKGRDTKLTSAKWAVKTTYRGISGHEVWNFLCDGQTKEKLAFTLVSDGGATGWTVLDGIGNPGDYKEARAYIDSRMYEAR